MTLIKNIFSRTLINKDVHFKEIFQGSVYVFGAKIIGTLFGIITSIIIARAFGAKTVGILAIVNSYFAVLSILALLGMNTSILKFFPKYIVNNSLSSLKAVHKKMISIIIVCTGILSLLLFFSAPYIASRIFKNNELTLIFRIASIVLIPLSFQQYTLSGLRALKAIKGFAIIQLIQPLFFLCLVGISAVYYHHEYTPVYMRLINIIIIFLFTIILFQFNFNRKTSGMDDANINNSITYRKILQVSFPMFITSSILVLIGKNSTLILGMLVQKEQVGYFSIALRLALLTTFILQSFNIIIAPKFSELYSKGNISELFNTARKTTRFIFWIITPIIVLFIAFGKILITKFYGIDFEISYYILLLLLISFYINSIAGSVGYFLNMCGHEKILRNISIITITINITTNYLLIIKYGIYGAAYATIITQIFYNVALSIIIWQKFKNSIFYFPLLSKPIN